MSIYLKSKLDVGSSNNKILHPEIYELARDKTCVSPVSYTHLTLPTTPYV